MGGRDHSCEVCGYGGLNSDLIGDCICPSPFDYSEFRLIDAWHGGLAKYQCKLCCDYIITECLTETDVLESHREKCDGL